MTLLIGVKKMTTKIKEYDKHLKNKDEALLYLIKRLEEAENDERVRFEGV